MTSETQGKKKFVLIDGNAILHRAYHALPPLTDRSGQLINAAYGFSTMLLRVIEDLKPDCLAVAFDTEEPTFRQMEYLGYQAKRPQMAEDLASQIEKVHEILEAFGIPIYSVAGFEADDVIGTLARQAIEKKWEVGGEKLDKEVRSAKKSHIQFPSPASHFSTRTSSVEVIIVTGDRDMMQLVEPKIKVYAPVRGLSESEMFDEGKIKEKFGIQPSQIVDYKGLVGDPSDNYPGVPGIGPKTASGLLKKHHTLENIYRHLVDLPESVNKKLTENKDLAFLSQKLARIVTNAPVELDLGKCRFDFTPEEKRRVADKFAELGFKSLAGRLATTETRKRSKSKSPGSSDDSQGELF